MICATCGNSNIESARFCHHCGATLTRSQTAEAEALAAASEAASMRERATNLELSNAPSQDSEKKDELIGRTIDGRYRIDELIGLGGMGSVYRATRLLIGDQVAIKILHTERVSDPHAAERFRREAQAAARLKHPNAVSIYDFGITGDGLQFLVMELVEGESLRQIVKQQGPLPASVASEIITQVCGALDEAHRQQIVHRDIKPDNIIIHSTLAGLRVKVLDFGIAKLRDDVASHLTQTGSVMGTPHYMSPEQCLGEELDGRADVYSLGIVLYEMLCGRVPFNSPISTAVVVQHVNQPPAPPRSINVGISPMVEAVVLHALEKRREERPQTAGALAREFASATGGATPDYPRQASSIVDQPIQLQNPDDERTVESGHVAAASGSARSSREMAPTVHLASLSGGTGRVAPGRATAGSGALPATAPRQGIAVKYVVGAAAIVLLGTTGLAITWRLTRNGNNNVVQNGSTSGKVNSPAQTAQLANKNPGSKGSSHDGLPAPQGMTYVRGGTFMMGSNEGDPDSRPSHSVTVKPFYLDIYEVTCEDYRKFVDAKGHAPPKAWINGSYPAGWERHPVTGVSWEDADAYARYAEKRLPTEEEWEFAARGASGLKYPWGSSWRSGCANAGEEGKARKGMADVGSHDCGSPFGAMDMIGNAWEWTASDWGPYPGGHLQFIPKGDEKVIRGGSWQSSQQYATGIYRSALARSGDKSGYDSTGFRCAKDTQP